MSEGRMNRWLAQTLKIVECQQFLLGQEKLDFRKVISGPLARLSITPPLQKNQTQCWTFLWTWRPGLCIVHVQETRRTRGVPWGLGFEKEKSIREERHLCDLSTVTDLSMWETVCLRMQNGSQAPIKENSTPTPTPHKADNSSQRASSL